MEFTGVYHKTSEQFSYDQNEEALVVNLKTGYDVRPVSYTHLEVYKRQYLLFGFLAAKDGPLVFLPGLGGWAGL